MKTKLLFLALLLFTIGGTFLHSRSVQAEERQTIVVTNLHFEDEKDLQVQTRPGRQILPLKNAKGVNNENFRLYDVTSAFNLYRQTAPQRSSTELDKEFIATMTDSQLATLSYVSATTQKTNYGDGTAVFEVTKKDEQGYHDYLLKEIGTGDLVAPMLIRLPIMDQNEELNTIHLYTKKVVKTDIPIQPTLVKKVNDKKISYTYGDTITYQVSFTVPSSVTNAKSIKLVDTYDTGLTKIGENSIWLDNQKLPNNLFTETTDKQQTTYTLDPKALVNYIGKTLRVEYSLQLNNNAPLQSQFNNVVQLLIEEKEVLKAQEVVNTGGKHFKKVEIDTNTPLTGAVFYLTNETGKFLVSTDGHYQWAADKKDALQLTSDSNGAFSINGLAYGHYYLHELQAPEGYIRNQEPIQFEIAKGSFESTPYQALQIVNKKAADSGQNVTPVNNPTSPNNSSKLKNLSTPSAIGKELLATGEKLSIVPTILGILFIANAAYVWKKRNEKK